MEKVAVLLLAVVSILALVQVSYKIFYLSFKLFISFFFELFYFVFIYSNIYTLFTLNLKKSFDFYLLIQITFLMRKRIMKN